MAADRPHTHTDHCETCGHAMLIERGYKIADPYLRPLFGAVCRSFGLRATYSGRKDAKTVYVQAPDIVTHERLLARYEALAIELNGRLCDLTGAFIREHCGDPGAADAKR